MTLSVMQELSIRDSKGGYRCHYCGKPRKLSDFPDQPGHHYFGNPSENNTISGHVHMPAACRFCLEVEE